MRTMESKRRPLEWKSEGSSLGAGSFRLIRGGDSVEGWGEGQGERANF